MSRNCVEIGQKHWEKPVLVRSQFVHHSTIQAYLQSLKCANLLNLPKTPHQLFTQLYTAIFQPNTSINNLIYPLFHTPYYYNYYIYINRKELTK